jgi:hypothetical protein
MFKFLRKYNKLMLAVFGVLLMITFLIPQAFDRLGAGGATGATVGYIGDGEKYTAGQDSQASRELDVLEKTRDPQIVGFINMLGIKEPAHWHMLVREAERAGLVRTAASVGLDDSTVAVLSQVTSQSPDFIRTAFAKFTGVAQLVGLYQTGGLYSDRRLMRAAEELMHQATVQMVVLEADGKSSQFEPIAEQIEEQFKKYQDVEAGAGEHGFGYKLPNRVKLEWLEIPVDTIREAAQQSKEFNNVAQRLHWRRNASDPAKKFPPVQDTGTIPDVVKNDLLEKLTLERADNIARFANEQLRLNRRGLPEKDGFVVLPPDWSAKSLDLQKLAAEIQAKDGVALPIYQSTGDWVALDKLNTLEKISRATSDKLGSTPIGFEQLVRSAKEFGGLSIGVPIQAGVAGPPLKESDGSVVVFRILEAEAAHSPASVDDVREQVIADLRKLDEYKKLAEQSEQLRAAAIEKGLIALALEHDMAVQRGQVTMADQFSPMAQQRMQFNMPMVVDPSSLPVIGKNREVNEAILKHALTLPQDKPVEELSEEQRTLVLPVPEKLAVVVVRLAHQFPLTRERFADLAQKNSIQSMIASEEDGEQGEFTDVFGFDAMKKRYNFTYTRESQPEQPPAEAAASAK